MSVRIINLFYAHEMTCRKWPVLLMCRDSISEGFCHTPVRQVPHPHSRPLPMAAKIAQGSRGRPRRALHGARPSLEPPFEFGDATGSAGRRSGSDAGGQAPRPPLFRPSSNWDPSRREIFGDLTA